MILCGAALCAGAANAQKLYKWVDDEGNVTYQDQPPPGVEPEVYAEDEQLIADQEEANNPELLAASNYPVKLYSVKICDACDLVRNLLKKNDVPFSEADVSASAEIQDELMQVAGQLSVPVLTIGPKMVYGYSSAAIKEELLNAGYGMDGKPGKVAAEPEQTVLSAEQVQERALRTAEELTSEFDESEDDAEFLDDLDSAEEIPEDERLDAGIGG